MLIDGNPREQANALVEATATVDFIEFVPEVLWIGNIGSEERAQYCEDEGVVMSPVCAVVIVESPLICVVYVVRLGIHICGSWDARSV